MELPDFSNFKSLQVINFKTGITHSMCKTDEIDKTPENILRLINICNEPLIYDFLFRRRFQGAPYDETAAKEFLSWADTGWKEKTHYVFLITDSSKRIYAAVDIKSNILDDAEIGYWASSYNSGLATNAVSTLCEIGKNAGYRSFVALTLQDNKKSAEVLLRNQFSDLGITEKRGKEYRKFRKIL